MVIFYGPAGNFTAIFHNVETYGHGIRMPIKNEEPSITPGSGATNHHLCYVLLLPTMQAMTF